MMSWICWVAVLTVGVATSASTALAGIPIPSPIHSTYPQKSITLVGRNDSNTPAEDSAGEFMVIVRNTDGFPSPGAEVTINFSNCTPDILVSDIQTFPGLSVTCDGAGPTVRAFANGQGVVWLRILGAAVNAGNSPGAGPDCAVLRAQGVFFNTLTIAAFDQNSSAVQNGVRANDVAVVISDVLAKVVVGRSDFNHDEVVQIDDVPILISTLLSGRSAQNVASICP
ncbi:MAG TPA: hypothetical protein VEY91_03440 [Candidatus Limnocylindria bacterium]|nr:hypothetical protein [Candidatus Limnocylindria bacterium]